MAHLLCMEVAGADWLKQPNTTGGLSFAWSQLSLTETTVQCFHFVWRGGNTRGPLGLLTGLGPGGNAGGKALGCREPSHNIPQTWLCCTWMLPPPTAGSSLVPHGPAVALGAAQHPAAPAGGCGLGRGQGIHGGARQEDGASTFSGARAEGWEATEYSTWTWREHGAGGWGLGQASRRGDAVSFPGDNQNPCGHNPECSWGDLLEQGGWTSWCPVVPSYFNPSVSLFIPAQCLQNRQFLCPSSWDQLSGKGFPGLGTLCSSCWGYWSAHPWLSTLGPGSDPATLTIIPPGIQWRFHECFCGIHGPVPGYPFLAGPLAGMETALPWAMALQVHARGGEARKYPVKASKMMKNDYT